MRLFRKVSGCVVSGDRVLRQQEAQRDHVEPEARTTRAVTVDRTIGTVEQAEGVVDATEEHILDVPVRSAILEEEHQDDDNH